MPPCSVARAVITTPIPASATLHREQDETREGVEMADKSEEKQTWWRTLPGILTAITGLAIGLNRVGLLGDTSRPRRRLPQLR
jgi:hypothetical protein